MTQCSVDEIEYEKKCIHKSSKKARQLLMRGILSKESAKKVTCEDDKQVINMKTGTCINAHRETAFKLLREQKKKEYS